MRARLLESWPLLSRLFHLMPWDVGRLAPAELAEYLHAAQEAARAAREAAG